MEVSFSIDYECTKCKKNMQYWYNGKAKITDSEQYPYIINMLMTNEDVLLYTMLYLKGEQLLAFCLSHSKMYKICQNDNFWKTKLEQEGIVMYRVHNNISYRELYNTLYFIRYIVDKECIDQYNNCFYFELNNNIKIDYYINLMQYVGITSDGYDESGYLFELSNKNRDKNRDKDIEHLYIWYDKFKKHYGITLSIEHSHKYFRGIKYQQLLNFTFNAYIDGAISDIYKEPVD
jgi:hypothetical protein